MKLGVNTVLFKDYSLREAFSTIKKAGYDGVELAAIQNMCDHVVLDDWQTQAAKIKALARQYRLELLSIEAATLDEERLEKAFAAAKALGIPIVNVGPGGRTGNDQAENNRLLAESIDTLRQRAVLAKKYGVALCAKAHVGSAIFNTPTTLRAMDEISEESFGVDMDPSHIYRAGEKPEEALAQVVSRVKHIHIRDCGSTVRGPGDPALQACGRGEIDLFGYFKVLADAKFDGPICLEVIGGALNITEAAIIAAESYGYMNACLKKLGIR